MAVSEDKSRVVVYLDNDVVDVLDDLAEAIGKSRSNVISNCIDVSFEHLNDVAKLGLTPRRIRALFDMLDEYPRLERLLVGESVEESNRRTRGELSKSLKNDAARKKSASGRKAAGSGGKAGA